MPLLRACGALPVAVVAACAGILGPLRNLVAAVVLAGLDGQAGGALRLALFACRGPVCLTQLVKNRARGAW